MQTPGVKKRFAAERQRLGLPVEGVEEVVDEAEATEEGEAQVAAKGTDAVTAPPSQPAAVAETADAEEPLPLEGEPVATDDAFVVEQSPSLPPLKFRVGPAAHLVLTPQGWRRTKPDLRRNMKKVILGRNEFLREYVDRKMEKFESELDGVVKNYSERTAEEIAQDAARLIERISMREEEAVSVDDPVSAQVEGDVRGQELSNTPGTPVIEDASTVHDTATDEVEASTLKGVTNQDSDVPLTALGPITLTEEETKQLRKDVRRVFRREAEGMLEKRVEEVIERKVEGQRRRNKAARQRELTRAQQRRAEAARERRRLGRVAN